MGGLASILHLIMYPPVNRPSNCAVDSMTARREALHRCGPAVRSLGRVSSAPGAGLSSHPARRPFDAASTRATLDLACEELRLDSTGAELLRLGENAIYRLPQEPVVARIARHADASHKEVDVARWLAQHDFPAVRLIEDLPQLRVTGGRVVTWWELVEEDPRRPEFTDLARILRRLHDLPAPAFKLPTFVPMRRVCQRLDHAPGQVGPADRRFLRRSISGSSSSTTC